LRAVRGNVDRERRAHDWSSPWTLVQETYRIAFRRQTPEKSALSPDASHGVVLLIAPSWGFEHARCIVTVQTDTVRCTRLRHRCAL